MSCRFLGLNLAISEPQRRGVEQFFGDRCSSTSPEPFLRKPLFSVSGGKVFLRGAVSLVAVPCDRTPKEPVPATAEDSLSRTAVSFSASFRAELRLRCKLLTYFLN